MEIFNILDRINIFTALVIQMISSAKGYHQHVKIQRSTFILMWSLFDYGGFCGHRLIGQSPCCRNPSCSACFHREQSSRSCCHPYCSARSIGLRLRLPAENLSLPLLWRPLSARLVSVYIMSDLSSPQPTFTWVAFIGFCDISSVELSSFTVHSDFFEER